MAKRLSSLASQNGHTDIVKLLIRAGATIPDDRNDLLTLRGELDKQSFRSVQKEIEYAVRNKRAFNEISPTNKKPITALEKTFYPNKQVEKKIEGYFGGKRKIKRKSLKKRK